MTRLDEVRAGGMRLLAICQWLSVVAIFLMGLMRQTGGASFVALLAAAISLPPTMLVLLGRYDAPTRLSFGISAAILPALLVYLFQGHLWQMDMHMSFFVWLAALAVLVDAWPILLASAVIALHHLALFWVVPGWVFAGGSSLGRVVVHGGLVLLEAAVLIRLVLWLGNLIGSQQQAHDATEAALGEAEVAKRSAEASLLRAEAAQHDADRLRADQRAGEAHEADESRQRRRFFADRIEEGVGRLVEDLARATGELISTRAQLSQVADAAADRSAEVKRAGAASEADIVAVAAGCEALSATIGTIGERTDAAKASAEAASAITGALSPQFDLLNRELQETRGILDLIMSIATQTNLLSLNATIEAARSGEAGRGFAVVAQEVKGLARQTEQATASIAERLANIHAASGAVSATIGETTAAVGSIVAATVDIASAIDRQAIATAEIASVSDRVSVEIARTVAMARALDDTIRDSRSVSGRADDLTETLSDRAAGLTQEFERMLGELRAA